MRGWSVSLCFIGACATFLPACTWARRATLDAVDPELRAKGEQLPRDDESRQLQLGSYAVSKPELTREEAAADGGLAADDVPRPVVQHRLDLDFEATDSGHTWAVRCTSQRRQPSSMDYAAALDENRDEIAVDCQLSQPSTPGWTFKTQAELSHNFAGLLVHEASKRSLNVEVVMWVERFGRLKRHLPDPVAQVRNGDQVIAAMVLGRPEQAWVARSVEPELAEAALGTMFALRFLPLGLEG